jgi:hypothetical protein
MKQKNNLQKSYFSYALYSVFFTALLFIIFGSNGWGPAAQNEQAIGEISRWCERVSTGFFREPVNTLGNLGFVVTGLYMFYKLSKDATTSKGIVMFSSSSLALLYASASTFLGPGSMAMHGTHTKFGAWLDNVSMVMYILILWIYNLKRLSDFTQKTFYYIYLSILIYFAIAYWNFGSGLGIGLDVFEVSIGLWLSTEVLVRFPNIYGRISAGFAVLIIQELFGNRLIDVIQNPLDNWHVLFYFAPAFTPNIEKNVKVKRFYTPWFWIGFLSFYAAYTIWLTGVPGDPSCNPDSLIQAHMIWHVLCSFATLCFFNFYRKEQLN